MKTWFMKISKTCALLPELPMTAVLQRFRKNTVIRWKVCISSKFSLRGLRKNTSSLGGVWHLILEVQPKWKMDWKLNYKSRTVIFKVKIFSLEQQTNMSCCQTHTLELISCQLAPDSKRHWGSRHQLVFLFLSVCIQCCAHASYVCLCHVSIM